MTPRQRKVFKGTFWTIFVLCIVITLFSPPTYEATAIVPLGKPLATAKRRRLKEDYWLVAIRKSVPAAEYTDYTEVFLQGATDQPRAEVIVDSGDAKYCANLANAVAKHFQEDVKRLGGRDLPNIEPATIPDTPIRPKKLQNILFGAFLGLIFGFLLSQIVGFFETKKAKGEPSGSPS